MEIRKLMKKQEKSISIEAAKTQKAVEAEGASTFVGASKIGWTLQTTMKNPKRKKESVEEFEYNSDDDPDWIDYLRTTNWRL